MAARISNPGRVRRVVTPHPGGWIQIKEERQHRYRIYVIPDSLTHFQCLVVDHERDSGGWLEDEHASFGGALTTALRINRDPQHQAFGAPIITEMGDGGVS
ncbi:MULTISPECIES: hypothetical protein [Xanthobacter]|uniref:hypothetical protein n=1 Tax=Xanthobacter TaxID=279 RepID=UPI0011F2FE07|nr:MULTISPECIES: hypothetical protein [Xanthobacter]MDI4655531.1 hypothetical protein [Xanthobacter autotrophicus]